MVPSEDPFRWPPLIRSLFVKATGPNRAAEHKKKTMKKEQTPIQIRSRLFARPEQLSTDTNAEGLERHESYFLLPTPTASESLKPTPRRKPPCARLPVKRPAQGSRLR